MLVAGEARGEQYAGKVGVAWTVRNRVEADLKGDSKPDWWGEGWAGVMLKRYQFSCFLPNDPNCRKLTKPLDHMSAAAWGECFQAAAVVFFGATPDNTAGADHYHVTNMPNPPAWRDPMRITTTLGHHVFYRLRP
jgi:spore germination cell wall hydrolase CwlJ-like protein